MKKNLISTNILYFLTVVLLFTAGIPVFADSESLEDGIYSAIFTTDSSMFNLCETSEGRGTLTVKDGEMVIHITLSSKNHLHLFRGSAEDAQKEGAELLDPSIALAREFGVSTIPHLFLFGPDGKIVQQGMRGEGIDALLRTVFK